MKKRITDQTKITNVLTRGVSEVLPSKKTLIELMTKRKIRLYLGIDPSGSLLTLGHAVVLKKLQQFADLGHEVILLVGNGTVKIGDPTGRDKARPVLSDDVIQANFKNWKSQASKILDFNKIIVKRNGDWLDKLGFFDFVKLMAQTTVQQLVERDMFQTRIKKGFPIFGHEILYPMLQGFDSVAMDVDLEIGGNDQTFNMLMGRHLQKVYNNHEKWTLTTPILRGTDGRKMSKSLGNFISMTEEPQNMFGKVMSIPDNLIIDYFTLLTDIPTSKIEKMNAKINKNENQMVIKKRLAFTITKIFHSKSAARIAQNFFENTVQKKEGRLLVSPKKVEKKVRTLINLLISLQPHLSKSQARRLVEQGGVEINGEKILNPQEKVTPHEGDIFRIGKRNLIKIHCASLDSSQKKM
jgi:tyrosyl-tRNA synthetase